MKVLAPPVRPLPLRALGLSIAALLVPVAAVVVFPHWTEDQAGILIWLTALVPAFLLTYYRGWQGASLALALGMAVLSVTQVVVLATGLQTPNWTLLLGVVMVFIGVGLGIGWLAELLHRERRAAEIMALTDPLTELPNRRHARVVLDRVAAAAERGQALSVVIFHLDQLEPLGDGQGRGAAEQVLRRFGEILKESTRGTDVGARFGAEEFLSVLWNADARGAGHFIARILHEAGGGGAAGAEPILVSGGVATYRDGWSSPDLLLSAADLALFNARQDGGGRFYLASPSGYRPMEIPPFVPVEPLDPGASGGARGPLRVWGGDRSAE